MSLGIGVIINSLFGGEAADITKYQQDPITAVSMTEESIKLAFGHVLAIELFDNGQSCCESRYMRTDDDLLTLVGAKLLSITIKDGPDLDDGECHEQQFLEIQTDKGLVTIANHNEHNGNYGGFCLIMKEILPADMPASD